MKQNKIPILTLCFILLSIAIFLCGVDSHEQIHKKIYDYYGLESEVGFFKTVSEVCETENCKILNLQNDLLAYNLSMFYFLITFGIAFIILKLELNDNEN